MTEHDIPASVEELFELGECSYSIVGYDREMDNIESLAYFLDEIGAGPWVCEDWGTQVRLVHQGFTYELVIDSGGLGDFYSHRYDVHVEYGNK